MDFVAVAVATALIWKLCSFGKAVLTSDKNGAVTQLFVWAAGIGVAFLLAASDFAAGVKVGGASLAGLNAASVVLFGVALGSAASASYDVKKSLDNTDSAKENQLVS